MKRALTVFGSILSILTLAAAPPPSIYPPSLEAKATASFETIVIGNNYSLREFGVLEKHKPITFCWNGEGKKVFATILDRIGDRKAEGGCLAICRFKDGKWEVATVFFFSMYRSDGSERIHRSYYIPEDLAWYENGEFHFAKCSMILVNYKMGMGMLETENKIAALNAFLSPWYWPYLEFPGAVDISRYEEIPKKLPNSGEKEPYVPKKGRPILGENLPRWFFHPLVP